MLGLLVYVSTLSLPVPTDTQRNRTLPLPRPTNTTTNNREAATMEGVQQWPFQAVGEALEVRHYFVGFLCTQVFVCM